MSDDKQCKGGDKCIACTLIDCDNEREMLTLLLALHSFEEKCKGDTSWGRIDLEGRLYLTELALKLMLRLIDLGEPGKESRAAAVEEILKTRGDA